MMKKICAPEFEVIHFTTEDVIVTSGTGGSGGTSDPITSAFSPDPTYFTSGNYINTYLSTIDPSLSRYADGRYYFFKVTDNGTNFSFDKSKYAPNINTVNPDYLYAWYKNIWITENKNKYSYPSLFETQ